MLHLSRPRREDFPSRLLTNSLTPNLPDLLHPLLWSPSIPPRGALLFLLTARDHDQCVMSVLRLIICVSPPTLGQRLGHFKCQNAGRRLSQQALKQTGRAKTLTRHSETDSEALSHFSGDWQAADKRASSELGSGCRDWDWAWVLFWVWY